MTGGDHLSAAAGAGERGGGLVAVLGWLGHHTALAAAGPLRAAAGPLGLLLDWLLRWAEKGDGPRVEALLFQKTSNKWIQTRV
jgi:hypothetical protein